MAEEIFVIGTKDKQHKAKTAFSWSRNQHSKNRCLRLFEIIKPVSAKR